MFKCVGGKQLLDYFPKTASVTITLGALARPDGSGAARNATATSTRILGPFMQSVASTAADFAANTKIPVLLAQDENVFEADVTGTLTTAMIGELRGIDATGQYVDVANTTNNQVTIIGYISASKALVKINGSYAYENAV